MTVYESALAAIAERRELLAAGTPGPWDIDEGDIGAGDVWVLNRLREKDGTADGLLIVAAVNGFAADTDALESVLLRHAPGLTMTGTRYCLGGHDLATLWKKCADAQAALTALGIDRTETPHE